ncbi:BapA/Bap/LapF family prefix-like domain-containing protein [Pseudomonas sp. KNUC1026]|uniref:BapA/Bap/LapF family prefix-like domain-containing protein n=1 Tax=Pseudomonas sp. KNUC1026 TaxID=2893890 RepID=UPI001F21BECB|nr:hypothetical protein [Pseudomonas sp. KNUC1026]UFH51527.1 hypothetical protein LN139_11455 [Pseudomonas sp. KNUC1026]
MVTLKSGEQTTLGNFFATNPQGVGSDIVFEGEDGALWQGAYDAEAFNGLTFTQISSIDELIAGAGVVGVPPPPGPSPGSAHWVPAARRRRPAALPAAVVATMLPASALGGTSRHRQPPLTWPSRETG